MLQILLTLLIFLIILIPFGRYLYHVAEQKKTFADFLFNPIDHFFFKLLRVDRKPMSWKKYLGTLILTNIVLIVISYLFLTLQGVLFFNPNGMGGVDPALSLNTVISFMTNTNLQHYSGESTLSYFSQMAVITLLMFTSAATGFSACLAFIRGIAGKKDLGNYFVDMIRVLTRVLIPLSIIIGLVLVSQGVVQSLTGNVTVATIEGKWQDIPMGPMASLEAIKHLGTNGGGFLSANASTPFENPNGLTNLIEIISMMLIPGSMVIVFSMMLREQKNSQSLDKGPLKKKTILDGEGRTIFIAMSLLFIGALLIGMFAESKGNPVLGDIGISQSMGSMEGKEVRFGFEQSSFFSTVTTAFTTGSVNNMHDSLTPIGGMVPLLLMMINVVFGGVGVGFMNMLMYVILAVFICGLMIGRTPEYLGKKIESREMRLVVVALILHPLLILGFSAIAISTSYGTESITNPGFHGLSQIMYEYASSSANNGSGFEGLKDHTVFWNLTTALVMFLSRYIPIGIQLAIAGSLMKKQSVNETIGTLKTDTPIFSMVLVVIVLIFTALTFFPVLSLGPIAEFLTLGH